MAEITAQIVKQLRDITGVGMMDCKKALIETNGDIDTAVKHLRKAGIAKAAKKLSRESKEGRIETAVNNDRKSGVMVEMSSETDFVAKNEEFTEFTKKIANLVLKEKIDSIDELLEKPFNDGKISDRVTELVAKIGENIKPRRFKKFEVDGEGLVFCYIHPGNKIGVMVEISALSADIATDDKTVELAKELAMQIAFSKPEALSKDDIDPEILAKEKEIFEEQARQAGKPEKAIEKIIEGRLHKFLKDNCLLSQEYIRESDLTVEQLIDKVSKELETELKLTRFIRFEVGTT